MPVGSMYTGGYGGGAYPHRGGYGGGVYPLRAGVEGFSPPNALSRLQGELRAITSGLPVFYPIFHVLHTRGWGVWGDSPRQESGCFLPLGQEISPERGHKPPSYAFLSAA